MPGPFLRFTVSRSGKDSLQTNDGMLNDQLSRAEGHNYCTSGTPGHRLLLGFDRRKGGIADSEHLLHE
jgi:hypothetical protein